MGRHIAVPPGDVFIHSGDLTFRGTLDEVRSELQWIDSLSHQYKLVVAGNHDMYFDASIPDGHRFRSWRIDRPVSVEALLAEFPSVVYLQDAAATIQGVKFYGSPWTPWFMDWAFNFPETDLQNHYTAAAKWRGIPDDTDVLVTHGPPYGILDTVDQCSTWEDNRKGCKALYQRIGQLDHLKLHVFGHLHRGYGMATHYLHGEDYNETIFVNAAINTIHYDPYNEPIMVDI
jgi:predicted phosphodiesterase